MNECLINFFKWSVWKMNKQGLHLSNPNIPKERRTSIMSASSKTIHTLFSVLIGQIRSRSEEVVDVLLSTLNTFLKMSIHTDCCLLSLGIACWRDAASNKLINNRILAHVPLREWA